MKKEKWKDIMGFEGAYAVSTFGRVWRYNRVTTTIKKNSNIVHRNLAAKYLAVKPKDGNYVGVTLRRDGVKVGYAVHRLVLETFVGPCPDGMQCRHLDGNKSNNRLDNLCWGTPKEDYQDRVRHGTTNLGKNKYAGIAPVRQCPNPKNNPNCKIRMEYATAASMLSAEKQKRVCFSCISYGLVRTEEQCQRISQGRIGIKDSEETRRKKSDATKGSRNPFYGREHSEESRRNIGLKGIGRIFSEASRLKMSRSQILRNLRKKQQIQDQVGS